jgi:long-chain acyl-CoA synthetase
MTAALLACDLTILDRFTPGGTLDAIERGGVNNLAVVPAMIDLLLAEPGFAARDGSGLRTITYGASPISARTLAGALAAFPKARLYQVYGQTEGGPTISVLGCEWHSADPSCQARLRSAGKPVLLTELRIVGEDGRDCPVGQIGEIAVRGPSISPGYWNQPDETAAAHRDGWLHTGDAGYIDGDGFLFIVDRIKDMIVSGGENVYAAEVERVIAQHPAVAQCAVIGVPSERWGEAVQAIVRPEGAVEADEIERFCRERLAGYKVPRSVSFREEAFPLTAAGKIDKRALRALHREPAA